MFQKSKTLTALLFFLLVAAVSVEAQSHKPKFRSQYHNRKITPGLSLIAGAGFSVVNSDNRGHNFGDNGLQPIGNNGIGPNVNLGAMYMFSPIFGVLGNLEYNGFKAAEDEVRNHTNDVSFKSNLMLASGSVVVNLIDGYRGYGGRGNRSLLIPYIKVGLGVAGYKASSFLEDQNQSLPALRDYPSFAAVVPIGAGLNIQYTKEISIAPEMNFTFTSTDYLDNIVDEIGFTGKNDHFITASVKVLYTPDLRRKRFLRSNR